MKRSKRSGRARADEPLAVWCELAIPGVCQGRATNRHHRLLRKHGGGDEKANTLDLCGSGTTGCHGYVHANPAESYERGWLIRSAGATARPVAADVTPESVVWTGDNEADVEAFARASSFSFVVGVPLDDSDDHPNHVDRTVLVVYPHDLDGAIWHWMTATPGDRVYADGRVESREDAT